MALRPNYAFKPIAEQALRSRQTIVPQRLNAALGVQTEFAVQHPTMEEYEQLGAHLYAIDAVLGEFAEEHGYAVYKPLSGGRYPNRRISQGAFVTRTIHIAMSEDPDGNRYKRFFPEIPYTIFGGVYIDDPNEGVRWHSAHLATRDIPFCVMAPSLKNHLIHFHSYISAVTEEYVYSVGCKTALAKRL